MALADHDPMPFGKHKGTPLKDVPPDYLLWLGDRDLSNFPDLEEYIEANRQLLELEVDDDSYRRNS